MRICSLIFLIFTTSPILAHESDELVKLKAANDALTMRVSELLTENKRLKAFAEKALVSKSQGKPVYKGCEPRKLRQMMVVDGIHYTKAETWLKENHTTCTTEELIYLQKNIGKWTKIGRASCRERVCMFV